MLLAALDLPYAGRACNSVLNLKRWRNPRNLYCGWFSHIPADRSGPNERPPLLNDQNAVLHMKVASWFTRQVSAHLLHVDTRCRTGLCSINVVLQQRASTLVSPIALLTCRQCMTPEKIWSLQKGWSDGFDGWNERVGHGGLTKGASLSL